jgi:hypothetical protein
VTHCRLVIIPTIVAFLAGCPAPEVEPSDTDPDSDTQTEAPMCVDGSTPLPFISDGGGNLFGDVATDFSFTQLDGSTFTFSEAFSGCDSYVFVVYRTGYTSSDQIFDGSHAGILLQSTDNVHYIIMSDEASDEGRAQRVQKVKEQIDSMGMASWDGRVHYSSDSPVVATGSLSAMFMDYQSFSINPANAVDLGSRGKARSPVLSMFGVDRGQRWDSGGSPSDYVGGPASYRMATALGPFYNHRHSVAKYADESEGTEIVLQEGLTKERVFLRTVTLPENMASFDSLEFDVEVTCHERNVFACSEWDRIARIDICLDGEECTQQREMVRWITPYWRRGQRRWVMDASPLLGQVPVESKATFRVTMGPGWERATEREIRVALRLSDQGGPKPQPAQFVFGGGNFNENYNTRETKVFTPPASAKRVELVYLVSGHGQTQGDNCAEWCDHRHIFSVNGTELPEIKHDSAIGGRGCADQSSSGVSPGQWGNWPQERAYWCPGLPVPVERIDITDQVVLGSENSLDYRGAFKTREPKGGTISLSSFVVWYE